MSTKQIKIWYGVLIGEILLAGLVFLGISFGAEASDIDSSGSWGVIRISIAGLGLVLVIVGLFLALPGVKKLSQTYKMAYFSRYVSESTIWILITLGLFELILRIIIGFNPGIVYEKDWEVVPIAGSIKLWGKEGYGITHYLEHSEIETPFNNGDISVVVLGDSYTEALQVSEDFKFASLAETNIRSKRKDVDFHNLGKSGYSIADFIYLAPSIKQYYHPEIIVLQLSPNDFLDSFTNTFANYFIITDTGNLELVHNKQYFQSELFLVENIRGRIYYNLKIYSEGSNRYNKILNILNEGQKANDQLQPDQAGGGAKSPNARMNEQLNLLKEAYSGSKVVLLLLPYSPYVDKSNLSFGDSKSLEIMHSAEQIGGYYVINPQAEFDRLIEQGHLPRGFMNSLPGVGHLNIYGHRIIGELLAEKILEVIK
jgi:lysophospholipase L1-like esterase